MVMCLCVSVRVCRMKDGGGTVVYHGVWIQDQWNMAVLGVVIRVSRHGSAWW